MHTVLVLCLAIGAVSAFPRTDTERIQGGTEVDISHYPYMVALLFSVRGVGDFTQACGGTIINNRSVLTAANCFREHFWADQWRHRVGSSRASSGGMVYHTHRVITHPNFDPVTWDMDIAILHISGRFSFGFNIYPASIAGTPYNLADNEPIWAAGWGTICSGCVSSDLLRHVEIFTINQATCRRMYTAHVNEIVTDNMFCTGILVEGGRDACQGDAGGPQVHNGVVVGVTSWRLGCALPQFPGVVARISSASKWIVDNA